MADANKTLITRAEVTSIITPATGRRALVIDGATIELGDTGVRDLTGLLIAGTVQSGRLLGRRVGSVVTFIFDALKTTAAVDGTNAKILDLGANGLPGFRAPYTESEAFNTGATAPQGRLAVAGNGVYVQFANSTFTYTTQMTFQTTDGWPSTNPGVADGSPIGA